MPCHILLACKNEPRLINNITNVYRYNVYTHIILHKKINCIIIQMYTTTENAQARCLHAAFVGRHNRFFFPPNWTSIRNTYHVWSYNITTTTIRMYMSLCYRNGTQLLFSTQSTTAYNKRNKFMHVNKSSHFGRVDGSYHRIIGIIL